MRQDKVEENVCYPIMSKMKKKSLRRGFCTCACSNSKFYIVIAQRVRSNMGFDNDK